MWFSKKPGLRRPGFSLSRIWELFITFNDRTNDAIFDVQARVQDIYTARFTLKASLIFALLLGGGFAFVGGDCYGRVSWISPFSVVFGMVTLFFCFQTFVLVRLTLWRMFRALVMVFCGHYLAYQSYAFWSLDNLGDKVEIFQDANVCQPYVYANIAYGYGWAFIPAILLVITAFFLELEKFEEEGEEG